MQAAAVTILSFSLHTLSFLYYSYKKDERVKPANLPINWCSFTSSPLLGTVSLSLSLNTAVPRRRRSIAGQSSHTDKCMALRHFAHNFFLQCSRSTLATQLLPTHLRYKLLLAGQTGGAFQNNASYEIPGVLSFLGHPVARAQSAHGDKVLRCFRARQHVCVLNIPLSKTNVNRV